MIMGDKRLIFFMFFQFCIPARYAFLKECYITLWLKKWNCGGSKISGKNGKRKEASLKMYLDKV